MNRFTKGAGLVTKVMLVGSSVALLGASCWQGVETNTNVGVETNGSAQNTNSEVNTNVDNANTVVTNTSNENTNSSGEIDTSDWLTYTNEEYGFSFRYPKGWEVKETRDEDLPENTLIYLGIRPSSMKEDSLYSFRITNKSIQQEVDSLKKIEDSVTRVGETVETVIAKKVAFKIEVTNTYSGVTSSDYFLDINGNTYLIFGQQDEIYDAFLSTLEF